MARSPEPLNRQTALGIMDVHPPDTPMISLRTLTNTLLILAACLGLFLMGALIMGDAKAHWLTLGIMGALVLRGAGEFTHGVAWRRARAAHQR